MPNIKNIIIFVAIGTAFALIYIFFIKPSPDDAALVSSLADPTALSVETEGNDPAVTKDFLNLLLSVKNIKLNDAIFSDGAFLNLHDSSITLVPDGNEGRVNPFAPLVDDTTI